MDSAPGHDAVRRNRSRRLFLQGMRPLADGYSVSDFSAGERVSRAEKNQTGGAEQN